MGLHTSRVTKNHAGESKWKRRRKREGTNISLNEVNGNSLDLELLDSVTDWDELGSTPHKSVVDKGADSLLQLGHIGLIIPWLKSTKRHSQ
jgi:hypothetical protein